jgi:integrase
VENCSALQQRKGGTGPAVRRRFTSGSWKVRNKVWSCKYPEHVFNEQDGTYKVVVRRKSFPGLNERAAKASMQATLDAVNTANKAEAQLVVPKHERTVSDVVAEWRKLVAPHHKPRGLETSESHLKAHIIPALGDIPLPQLNVRCVQGFVNSISIPTRNGKTVENIVLTLTGILNAMHKSDKAIPTVKLSDLTMPPKEKARPRFLTGQEIKRLIKASRGVFRTILMVLALSGMRINEVLGLRVEDIDFDSKVIHVKKSAYNGTLGTPKSAPAQRTFLYQPPLRKSYASI